jgi:hypothetical protein
LALSKKEETELVAKPEEMFHAALEHPSWKEWRSEIAPKCFRYREGDEWTKAERATLKRAISLRGHGHDLLNSNGLFVIN